MDEEELSISVYPVLYEILYLCQYGCINMGGFHLPGVKSVNPSVMKVEGMGQVLYVLLQLRLIPDEDIAPLATALK